MNESKVPVFEQQERLMRCAEFVVAGQRERLVSERRVEKDLR